MKLVSRFGIVFITATSMASTCLALNVGEALKTRDTKSEQRKPHPVDYMGGGEFVESGIDHNTDRTDVVFLDNSRYDWQASGAYGKFLAISSDGVVHGALMGGIDTGNGRRIKAYCVTPDLTLSGPLDVSNYRSGYSTVCVTSEAPDNNWAANSTVVSWHGAPVSSTISVFGVDFGGCWMAFQTLNNSTVDALWPHIAIDNEDCVHMVSGDSSTGATEDYAYYNSSCGSDWESEGVVLTENSNTLMGVPVAAKHTKAVALIYGQDAPCADEAQVVAVQWHHDVFLYENRDEEASMFDVMEESDAINLTNYGCPDSEVPFNYGVFAYSDTEGLYDLQEEPHLHVAYTTPVLLSDSTSFMIADTIFYGDDSNLWAGFHSSIWHLDVTTGEWSHIAGWLTGDSSEDTVPDPDAFRTNTDRPQLAIDPQSGYLYCIWSVYSADDLGTNGKPNGEIFAACSADNGASWGPRVNLTNTFTPDCEPGDCESETFASCAEFIDGGYLHVQYIKDLNPGAIPFDDNDQIETDNPLYYMRVPVDEIPPHDGTAWDADGHIGLWMYSRNVYWAGGHVDSIAVLDKVHIFNEGLHDRELTEVVMYHSPDDDFSSTNHIAGWSIYNGHPNDGGDYIMNPASDAWDGVLDAQSVTLARVWVENYGLPVADQIFQFRFDNGVNKNFRYEYLVDLGGGTPEPMLIELDENDLGLYSQLVLWSGSTNIETQVSEPQGFRLHQNYPNPFNPVTQIAFDLQKTGLVELSVYNLVGEKVSTLVNGRLNAGSHSVQFDAAAIPSGLYLYRLTQSGITESRKMILIK
jgi:hypothetical protein